MNRPSSSEDIEQLPGYISGSRVQSASHAPTEINVDDITVVVPDGAVASKSDYAVRLSRFATLSPEIQDPVILSAFVGEAAQLNMYAVETGPDGNSVDLPLPADQLTKPVRYTQVLDYIPPSEWSKLVALMIKDPGANQQTGYLPNSDLVITIDPVDSTKINVTTEIYSPTVRLQFATCGIPPYPFDNNFSVNLDPTSTPTPDPTPTSTPVVTDPQPLPLLAAEPIPKTNFSDDPTLLTMVGQTLYFSATNGVGYHLFRRYDGVVSRVTNTSIERDDSPAGLYVGGGRLYFTALNPDGVRRIYYIDSPDQASFSVREIPNPVGGSYTVIYGEAMRAVGNSQFYFVANNGSGTKLFRYDMPTQNSNAVTTQISNIRDGNYDQPSGLIDAGGTLYFMAYNSGATYWQSRIYAYDTSNISVVTTPITSSSNNERHFTVFNDKLYFVATISNDDVVQRAVGSSITNIFAGYGWSSTRAKVTNLVKYNNKLCFAQHDYNGRDVACYNDQDGSFTRAAGNSVDWSLPQDAVVTNSAMYFIGTGTWSNLGYGATPHVWRYTGGTGVGGQSNYYANDYPSSLTPVADTLYHIAGTDTSNGTNGYNKRKLFVGSTAISNVNPGGDDSIASLTPDSSGDTLYFTAINSSGTKQLYRSVGVTAPNLPTPALITTGKYPKELTVAPGKYLYFVANNSDAKRRLYLYNGNNDTVTEVSSLNQTGADDQPHNLLQAGGKLFFTALKWVYSEVSGNALFVYDGTSTTRVTTANLIVDTQARPVALGDYVYFSAFTDTSGTLRKMYRTDGTTVEALTTLSGAGVDEAPRFLTVFGDRICYVAYLQISQSKVICYDPGTGTPTQISNTTGNGNDDYPLYLNVWNSQLLFVAYDAAGSGKKKLYSYNGTSVQRIVNVNNNGDDNIVGVYPGSDAIYFYIMNMMNADLYRTTGNGSAQLVATPCANVMHCWVEPEYRQIVVVGAGAYFTVEDDSVRKLYFHDGSSDPPQLVIDINGTDNDDDPNYLTYYAGKLYFSAKNGNGNSRKLYVFGQSQPILDLNPGGDDNPSYPSIVNGELLFFATDLNSPANSGRLYAYNGTNARPVASNDFRPVDMLGYGRWITNFKTGIVYWGARLSDGFKNIYQATVPSP